MSNRCTHTWYILCLGMGGSPFAPVSVSRLRTRPSLRHLSEALDTVVFGPEPWWFLPCQLFWGETGLEPVPSWVEVFIPEPGPHLGPIHSCIVQLLLGTNTLLNTKFYLTFSFLFPSPPWVIWWDQLPLLACCWRFTHEAKRTGRKWAMPLSAGILLAQQWEKWWKYGLPTLSLPGQHFCFVIPFCSLSLSTLSYSVFPSQPFSSLPSTHSCNLAICT